MFNSPLTVGIFKSHFMADLRDVLGRLHNRDERNKLFPKDFWIIDKKLADGIQHMNFQQVTKLASATLLENCP